MVAFLSTLSGYILKDECEKTSQLIIYIKVACKFLEKIDKMLN